MTQTSRSSSDSCGQSRFDPSPGSSSVSSSLGSSPSLSLRTVPPPCRLTQSRFYPEPSQLHRQGPSLCAVTTGNTPPHGRSREVRVRELARDPLDRPAGARAGRRRRFLPAVSACPVEVFRRTAWASCPGRFCSQLAPPDGLDGAPDARVRHANVPERFLQFRVG